MSRTTLGLTLLFLPILAAATAAPVPNHLRRKEPTLYFPTRVGAKWVYQGDDKREWTLSVTAVEDTDAGKLVSVTRHLPNGETSFEKKMLVTPTRLTQIEGYDGKLKSPWCWLKLPFTKGNSWESDCSSEHFEQKWKCSIVGTEEVEVAAGKFTAIGVRTTLVSRPLNGGIHFGPSSSVKWYAPGVGVVKDDGGKNRSSWELKSFTP